MKYLLYIFVAVTLFSCKKEKEIPQIKKPIEKPEQIIKDFGITFNDYIVKIDTLQSGDTFSTILDGYELNNNSTFQVTEKIKDLLIYGQLEQVSLIICF